MTATMLRGDAQVLWEHKTQRDGISLPWGVGGLLHSETAFEKSTLNRVIVNTTLNTFLSLHTI